MVCVWLILNELEFNHKPSPDLSRLTEHLKRQLQAASMNTQTIVLAILAMCIASGSSAPRERRRAKPRTDQPIDLMELRRQVSSTNIAVGCMPNCTRLLFPLHAVYPPRVVGVF